MKLRPVGAECSMWTDGQTDTHGEANCRLSQFAKAPKNQSTCYYYAMNASSEALSESGPRRGKTWLEGRKQRCNVCP